MDRPPARTPRHVIDKNPKRERLHLQMLQQLRADYGECFGYVSIGIEPQPKYNVYTTWALDWKSRAVVDSAFASAWQAAGPQVRSEFDRLQKCRNADGACRRDAWHPGRVPLS